MAVTRIRINSQDELCDLAGRMKQMDLTRTKENSPKVLVTSNWGRKWCSVSAQTIESTSDEQLRRMQWYFKQYPTRDAFSTNKAEAIRRQLREIGQRLIREFFPIDVYSAAHREDRLLVEIDVGDESLQGSLLAWLNKIYWEVLEDKAIWMETSAFEPLEIHVVRVHSSRRFNLLRSRTRRMTQLEKKGAGRNVLAITARPASSKDIPHRLITQSIASACKSANDSVETRIRLQVVRPGTFKALTNCLENHPNGYYDVLHLDLHGESDEHG
jgi:hypothetical protein